VTLAKYREMILEVFISIMVVALASTAIFRLNGLVSNIRLKVSSNAYLNAHTKYQIALLVLSLVVLVLTYFQNPSNFRLLFSIGNLSAPANPVKWFGIMENHTWIFVGLYLCIIITLGTLGFVYYQFKQLKVSVKQVLPYAAWIIAFSLTNSFSEEAIYRVGIISPLYGDISMSSLVLLSAVIFGIVHFGGMPHGLLGMLMAGFLGWFLAKSVVETQGIFWAWMIHFIQDVVIYVGFIVGNIANGKKMKYG
jgi:membrane protease YdiL (CAAX protease family)